MQILRKIRKKYQREIGLAQDLIVENIYKHFPKTVLHGGTLIWRSYGGNRFSEDLDFYLPERNEERIKKFFKDLEELGFKIEKLRIKERSIFSKIFYGRALIRVEAIFKKVKAVLMDYECLDGRKIPILGLETGRMIEEKIAAFLERGKMRDLYDIYFLLKFVGKQEALKKKIYKLLIRFRKPKDEADLKKVIIFGYSPTSKEIFDYLKKWLE